MTLTEKAVCTLYTGVSFCNGEECDAVYKYAEKLLGFKVYTHDFADEGILRKLKNLSRGDFIKLCSGIDLGFTIDGGDAD